MKRVLAFVLLALVLGGCAGGPARVTPVTGRVTGHVTSRACGGAAVQDQPACPIRPASGVSVTFRQLAGGDISTTTTDADGAYAITLPPGDYLVGLRDATSPGPVRSWGGPKVVTVRAGKTITAEFGYTIQLL